MSTEENKALVRRFEEEVWNGRNPSLVDEFFAASHIFRAAGSPPLDREGHRQMIAHFQDAFPDGRNTSEELLAEGDKVVQRWTFRGTHQGAFQGIPPTGRQVTLTGISIWRVDRRQDRRELARARHPGPDAAARRDSRTRPGRVTPPPQGRPGARWLPAARTQGPAPVGCRTGADAATIPIRSPDAGDPVTDEWIVAAMARADARICVDHDRWRLRGPMPPGRPG